MRIGVFCSGGDAPGMNACLRAVVRSAGVRGHEVVGILRGYQGILDEQFFRPSEGGLLMPPRSVSGIARLGGSILFSARSDEFRTEAGQRKAAANLRKHQIDALIPIGGDGTNRGAMALSKFWPGQIVACPGTIDNDLKGSDFTIGFATAVNTAVEAVDKIRDTAESHERMFLVEVMGRHSGFIAVYTALASSAESVCLPETPTNIEAIAAHLHELKQRGKASIMLIIAEGDELGGAEAIHQKLRAANCPYPTRAMVLGHLQRGGSPMADDRILASLLGDFAVQSILAGANGVMAGQISGQLTLTPLPETYEGRKPIPKHLLALLDVLAY